MRTKIQCVNDNVRLSQWKQIIQNCRDSGLPVKRWCDENNISEPSYYYYLKKFRELAIKEADDHQDFYPIVVNEEKEITHENIEIIKGDIHIQVPDNIDIDVLVNMLKVCLCRRYEKLRKSTSQKVIQICQEKPKFMDWLPSFNRISTLYHVPILFSSSVEKVPQN